MRWSRYSNPFRFFFFPKFEFKNWRFIYFFFFNFLIEQKDDPLKRIQEEINEVARRERELREKMDLANGDAPTHHNTQIDGSSAQSDDSGVSSASSPINGVSTNVVAKESKYIRSNTINPTSTKLYATSNLTRTLSTPQIFMPTRFNMSSGQKGLMQRFIASRGKFAGNNKPKDTFMVWENVVVLRKECELIASFSYRRISI